MNRMVAAAIRAAGHCWHPRILLWSLLPLALAGGALAVLGLVGFEPAVARVRQAMTDLEPLREALDWLEGVGAGPVRAMLPPTIVVALALPLVVLATLLVVGVALTPVAVDVVARARHPGLERRHGARGWQCLLWSLASACGALLALAASLPLWLVPPLAVVLPPLIWGWLATRVFAFDVLAAHASAEERRWLLRRRRWPLLGIGLACGLFGAAPALLWALSAVTFVFTPLLVVALVWGYTIVFSFAALWFAHFALDELAALRARVHPPASADAVPAPAASAPAPAAAASIHPGATGNAA